MQTTSDRTARALLAVGSAALGLAVLHAPLHSAEDVRLIRRVFRIGTTKEVRDKAAEDISPHTGRVQLDGYDSAEVGHPPNACGVDVYRRFGKVVRQHFQVATLTACQVSPAQVDCPTAYLPGYDRVFLELLYQNVPSKQMMVAVDAKKRGPEGGVSPGAGALSDKDKLAIAEIFDASLDQAMCRSAK